MSALICRWSSAISDSQKSPTFFFKFNCLHLASLTNASRVTSNTLRNSSSDKYSSRLSQSIPSQSSTVIVNNLLYAIFLSITAVFSLPDKADVSKHHALRESIDDEIGVDAALAPRIVFCLLMLGSGDGTGDCSGDGMTTHVRRGTTSAE